MSRVSDTLIDTVFDGRYRILRKLGSGGMANVYLAEDTELGRRVAIKILNERYAEDELFVERFRREAKAAAGLSHPNIVSIYDRGEAQGTYYIAMEVIEGKSLKELIRASGRLRPAQTIAYARQILSALRFAHRNGIVHRDIKPHNVLIGAEERLKVTDFGIARAGASQMTEAGSIMGTAQYLSPEQARGAQVTAASDLYSVGVVMYEMLTGEVPFGGDNPVEIAMKHVSERPRPPSARVQGVPPELDQIVLRCLAKNPADRYQTAEELDADLARVEAGLPVARETTEAATAVLRGVSAPAPTQALPPRQTPSGGTARPPRRPPYDPYAEARRKKRSIVPWLFVLVLLAAAAVAGWYVYQQVQDRLIDAQPVPVPNVVGIVEQKAVDKIKEKGLESDVRRRFDDEVVAGVVISQVPGASTRVAKGETVTIVVSKGIEQVTVPKVSGLALEEALAALDQAGLKADPKYVFSDKVEPGIVISQDPKPDGEVAKGTVVELKVSKGAETVTVPDVLQQDQASAEAELADVDLVANVVVVASDQPAGIVVAQFPDPGAEADKGSAVEIDVSEGPQETQPTTTAPATIAVPDVVGHNKDAALAMLTDAGFASSQIQIVEQVVLSPDQDGLVLKQDPAGGVEADPGATITLTVGTLPGPGDGAGGGSG